MNGCNCNILDNCLREVIRRAALPKRRAYGAITGSCINDRMSFEKVRVYTLGSTQINLDIQNDVTALRRVIQKKTRASYWLVGFRSQPFKLAPQYHSTIMLYEENVS